MQYIVTLEGSEEFNTKGESLGISDKVVICYSRKIGRRRYYRQYISAIAKGMKILSFKILSNAEHLRDTMISKTRNTNRKVEEVIK